ncbi:MAG TPA: nucleotidyltransferase family protein [Candidatus Methylomirabilis sp.]
MDRSAEQSLLMEAGRAFLSGETTPDLAALAAGPLDWGRIIRRAETERLGALLYAVLSPLALPAPISTHYSRIPETPSPPPSPIEGEGHNSSFPLPTAGEGQGEGAVSTQEAASRIIQVRDRLRAAWLGARRQYLLGIQQLTRVLSAFEREGVPVIPLRGPALAELLYRDPALRSFTDLDLLVHEGNLPRALSLLSGLGYRHMEAGLPLSLELTWRHAASFVPEAPEEIPIDLHWGMVDYPGLAPAAAITQQDLWDRAVRVEGPYGVRWEFCPEDLLISLALHWAVHHALSGLIWQLDLALLILRYGDTLDWDAVIERAGRWRIRGPVFFALREVRDCLEAAVPAWVLDRLRPVGLRPTLFDWLHQRGEEYRERLDYLVPFLVMDRGSDMLRALASAVVPPASWLRCRYGKASVLGAYMAHCARIGRVCARTTWASLGRAH